MIKRILQLLGIVFGGMIGSQFGNGTGGALPAGLGSYSPLAGSYGSFGFYTGLATGALAGLLLATALAGRLERMLGEGVRRASDMPAADLLAGAAGLTGGLVLSALLYPSVSQLPGAAATIAPALLTLGLGYVGLSVGLRKKEELTEGLHAMMQPKALPVPEKEEHVNFEEHKIMDTSVIIDGRIADICKTGFIEGTLVIPEFVLEELQHIADSSDLLKRNRGRRGLDILNKIQKELDVKVLIYEGDFEEIGEVDSKLVKLAKLLRGKVLTNDFNLNKVCELQGVSVLNINDLANAVKPVVLPGEEIVVQIIKDGKEHGQGVAYLDDGTMIVVEGGRDYIGMTMEVLVTSVLQTSAGRMIFAKPKLLEKAL
ncbi:MULTISPECIES: PIN/TRAM domain-containing protein [Paenibacillus]|uniref:PIN/TRAM domain-containing protein n=1 Tax=Paenibacillus TaxID=44249 RepID=UPI00038FAD2D|nr:MULTISPECIES: PIN/TRAM domain-containing protein [Paenibacillus]KKC48776.1 twitching motility protein PilT [Paenibacillus sp. D9]CDN41061.1 Integral membrane protein (PIN domain superfamily) [Paenibacillus sp. P22]